MIDEYDLRKARQRCHAGYVLDLIIRNAQYGSHTWEKLKERRSHLSVYFYLFLEALDLTPVGREAAKFKRALEIDDDTLIKERASLKHNMTTWWER